MVFYQIKNQLLYLDLLFSMLILLNDSCIHGPPLSFYCDPQLGVCLPGGMFNPVDSSASTGTSAHCAAVFLHLV